MTTSNACAKTILFGEHAVVYGYPAIAIPLPSICAYVEIIATNKPDTIINAPDIGISTALKKLKSIHPIRYATDLFGQHHQTDVRNGLRIKLHSDIPIGSGMGSGAAITTALFKGLFQHFGIPYTKKELSKLVYEVEKIHHGTPSGIDNTVISFEKAVLFQKYKEIQFVNFYHPFHIIIADTGISTPTKETVCDVRRLFEIEPNHTKQILQNIGSITLDGLKQLQLGNLQKAGQSMISNHNLLKQLNVSNKSLDDLVTAALVEGAYGAKLSGGGRGGIVIALVNQKKVKPVMKAMSAAGAIQCYHSEISPNY